jgi:hypothetical protein
MNLTSQTATGVPVLFQLVSASTALVGLTWLGACASKAAAIDESTPAPLPQVEVQEPQGDQPLEPKRGAAPGMMSEPLRQALAQIAELQPFGQPPGTTEAEWRALEADAAALLGASGAGATWLGTSAECQVVIDRLSAAGQPAWPAILNRLIRLDLEEPSESDRGLLATMTMDRARGSTTGIGFDWRTAKDSSTGELDSKNRYFNARLTLALYEVWGKVLEDPQHWAKIDKSEQSASFK